MLKPISLFSILVLGTLSCGVQGGRFVTTGSHGNAIAPNVGCLDIVTGYDKKQAAEAGGDNEGNLLYVLIITPSVQQRGTSSSDDFDKYITTLNRSWSTDQGTFAISIHWNRQTDVVAVGKQEFPRERGDVFLVRMAAGGEIVCQQFPSLGSHADSQQMLNYIQQQLPNDKLVSALKLDK